MDFDSIKRCWREESLALPPRLEEGPVKEMLTNRTADLRRDVRRRLRREAGYDLPLAAVCAAGLAGGLTLSRILASLGAVVVLGGISATLWWAERRIAATPLDRSLREALIDLGRNVDAAGRMYVAAYIGVFVVAAAVLISLVWQRYGFSAQFLAILVFTAMAVLWSRSSGRGYVEQMFRRDRLELAECLRQLER
jgi:hypothetical protein